jgi:hypothetical protein
MTLWHMHSKVLDGFYASEVYVSAAIKAVAVNKAVEAFNLYIQKEFEDYGFNPLISAFPDDEEYVDEMIKLRAAFKAEAEEKLETIPNNSVIFRRT